MKKYINMDEKKSCRLKKIINYAIEVIFILTLVEYLLFHGDCLCALKNKNYYVVLDILMGMQSMIFSLHISYKKRNQNTSSIWHGSFAIYIELLLISGFEIINNFFWGTSIATNIASVLHINLQKYTVAIGEMVKVIGIGSVVIMAIVSILSQRELNISYVALMSHRYPCYYIYIIFHLINTAICIFFAEAKIASIASMFFITILYDSIVLTVLFSFFLLQPNKRRNAIIKYWRERIEDNPSQVEACLDNLINELTPQNGPFSADIFDCIIYGLVKIVQSMESKSTKEILLSLSSVHYSLLKNKSAAERRYILKEIFEAMRRYKEQCIKCNRTSPSDNDEIIIYLAYLYSLQNRFENESSDYSECLSRLQSEVFHNIPGDRNVPDSLLSSTLKCGTAALFWVAFLSDNLATSIDNFIALAKVKCESSIINNSQLFSTFLECIYANAIFEEKNLKIIHHFISCAIHQIGISTEEN